MAETTYYQNLPKLKGWTQGPNDEVTNTVYADGTDNAYKVRQSWVFPGEAYLQDEHGKRNGVNTTIYTWFDKDGNIISSDTTYNDTWQYPRTQKYIELQNRFEGYPRSRDPFNYLNYSK